MEHSLLRPHQYVQTDGIPLENALHLIKGSKYYDHNIRAGFGTDNALDEINRLQEKLGTLSGEQLEKRVVADFCCIWRYDYPERVRRICAVIGGGSHTQLRLHYQVCPARRKEFIDYAQALKGWIDEVAADDCAYYAETARPVVDKVYGLLGSHDPLKKKLAERTFLGLAGRAMNCSFWGTNTAEPPTDLRPYTPQELSQGSYRRLEQLEADIRREMGSAARDFLCDVGGTAEPACHFKFTRRVDILVSSIGCLKWRGNLPPKDAAVSGRRQITADICAVLEQYWRDTAGSGGPEPADALRQELFGLLGEPDDFKRWLAGSLWKNIKVQTERNAYPMKRWVEFVRVAEDYLCSLD